MQTRYLRGTCLADSDLQGLVHWPRSPQTAVNTLPKVRIRRGTFLSDFICMMHA